MEKPELINRHRSFEGWVEYYKHRSPSTRTEMRFSIYLPPQVEKKQKLPVLYWLSGLTCTEENFMAKAGAQAHAARAGVILVAPDTSPRGAGIAGEDADWDLGTGAGFYVNATESKWAGHYRMYDYVKDELPALLHAHFPTRPDRESIFGHSMGGHGAMVLALRQPDRYRSVSAFSPIGSPSQCPWGQKAFTHYLGADHAAWAEYDSSELIRRAKHRQPILVDQGLDDKFLNDQLKPELLEAAAKSVGYPLELRRFAGYDHSYYFIASFVREHIEYHAARLNA